MERVHPSYAGKGGFAPVMRLATAIGVAAGVFTVYQRSTRMITPLFPESLRVR